MKQKKIPLRKCMGCNESKPKKELVRIVKNNSGEVSLDTSGKKPGRGAYVCFNSACFTKVKKSKRIDRVLECTIPDSVYDEMTQEIQKGETVAT